MTSSDDTSTRIAEVLARPRREAADSFVLHAPLEGLSRLALLERILPSAREAVRERLDSLVERYAAVPALPPEPHEEAMDDEPPEALARSLDRAFSTGEIDEAGRLARRLADATSPAELVAHVVEPLLPRTGAAAHGAILLAELLRPGANARAFAHAFVGLAREVAREPAARMRWHERATPRSGSVEAIVGALRRVPHVGDPGTDFIAPTVRLAEESGAASAALGGCVGGVDPHEARRALARVAALSMLEDDPAKAPYIWTHTLTIPWAMLSLVSHGARPETSVATASTLAFAFRAVHARTTLSSDGTPREPLSRSLEEALVSSPHEAAAFVFHHPARGFEAVVAELLGRAASHADAHVAKYALVSDDAAADDPAFERHHRAALAHLLGVWAHASPA